MMNELLIAVICTNMSGHNGACNKTVEAVNKQAGLYENVERVENAAADNGRKKVGNKAYQFLVYSAAGAQVGMGKTAAVKLGGGPLCDKITITGAKKRGSVGLGWDF